MLKSKMFKSDYADIQIEVLETGWITIRPEDEGESMVLGTPENERIRLIEEAIAYARKIINKKVKK